MTIFIRCDGLSKSFGTKKLFDNISLSVFKGDRIGLIGPNGAGKSTLLKILAGIERADTGEIAKREGIRTAVVPQECDFSNISIREVIEEVLDPSFPSYEKTRLAETALSRVGFDTFHTLSNELSGGWKKRLAIARAIATGPDLIFYDEPTNHLDIESIVWLEGFLQKESISYVVVSHDRYFLEHVTTRMIDLDPAYPSGMLATSGSYQKFLEHKQAFLSGQIQTEKSLLSKVKREKEWLKAGVKARTTKSQSRIDQAHDLIEQHKNVKTRNIKRKAHIDFVATERQTRKLLSAKNLSMEIGEKKLFEKLDILFSPGTRVGLLGPNGAGKTTLLKILEGSIEPTTGTIKRADALKTVYFDQHRTKLPLEMSLKEALSPKGDFVEFQGRSIHVNGWCERFLFSPEQLPLPIGTLSGGERARISIAHLMLSPADLLLLDEPTNDLDIATLEILEESLLEFQGALCLITHDRFMLDRVCNSYITLQGYFETKEEEKPQEDKKQYLKNKEILQIERKIEKLEKELKKKTVELENPTLSSEKMEIICKEIALIEAKIEELYILFESL